MRKRILITCLAISVIGILLYSALSIDLNYRTLVDNTKDHLKVYMRAYNSALFTFDEAGAISFSETLDGARVTFISPDGTVIADSENKNISDSFSGREDVKDALNGGDGFYNDRKAFSDDNSLSYCKKFDNGLVRITISTASEWRLIVQGLPTLCWVLLIDLVICLIISFFATSYVLKPVEELARKSRFTSAVQTKYSELQPITNLLNHKNVEIQRQLEIIEKEKVAVMSAQNSKNDFIANITHEMNTPLTSIKGFAELLNSGALNEAQTTKALTTISAQADRLSGLIACIIDYNAIDNDELPAYEVNISNIARETLDVLEPSIQERGITVEENIDDNVIILTRHERISEIFGNLIRNATKYNKENGKITVTVKGGSFPYMEVADTGIGIAEENMDKIFSRFFTVDKSHSGKHGGFGLGLAVVKKICNRAGWKLTMKSKIDEGTSFKIEF